MNLIDDYDFNLKVLEKMNDFLPIICDSFEVEMVQPLCYLDFCQFYLNYKIISDNNIFMFLEQYVIDNSPELSLLLPPIL